MTGAAGAALDPVEVGIMWSRLASVADEMVSALVRTAFSTMVRESGDYSCMIFDAEGRLLVQGAASVPSFTGTGPHTLGQMLAAIPPACLNDGDILITNDPWIGTGHVYDINVVKPVFHLGRLVGYCLTVSHLSDVGGVGMGSNARDVFEEGFSLPPVKLFEAGNANPFLIEFIRTNVRLPDLVLGDIYSNIAACNVGARGIAEILHDHRQDSTLALAEAVFDLTRKAIRTRLQSLPKGEYRAQLHAEGGATYPDVLLAIAVTVSDVGFGYDFTGTGPVVKAGVNVPICYSRAFCYFCTKVLIAPNIPNNQVILDVVTVTAPENCLLNALRPHPTGARHVFGHFVGPLIFSALAPALPGEVQADSGMVFQVNMRGRTRAGRAYSFIYFSPGGYGAMAGLDGRAALPAPSNMIGASIEVWEEQTDCTFLRKEILPDTGGAGEFQGGNGQVIILRNDSSAPIEASFMASRTQHAAQGFLGGQSGAKRAITVDGRPTDPRARVELADGSVIEVRDAGGGGFGPLGRRSRRAVAMDLDDGRISPGFAAAHYGFRAD
jgi:N-methylhydantoinase B